MVDQYNGAGHNHQVLRGGRALGGQDLHALPVRAPQVRREGAAHHRLRLLHQAQVERRRQGGAAAAVGHRGAGALQLGLQDVPAGRPGLRDRLLGHRRAHPPRDPQVEEDHRGEHRHGPRGQDPLPPRPEQVRPHQQREARPTPDQEVPRRLRQDQRLLRLPPVLRQGQPQHRGGLPAPPRRNHPPRVRQEQPHQEQQRGQEGTAQQHRTQPPIGQPQARKGRLLLIQSARLKHHSTRKAASRGSHTTRPRAPSRAERQRGPREEASSCSYSFSRYRFIFRIRFQRDSPGAPRGPVGVQAESLRCPSNCRCRSRASRATRSASHLRSRSRKSAHFSSFWRGVICLRCRSWRACISLASSRSRSRSEPSSFSSSEGPLRQREGEGEGLPEAGRPSSRSRLVASCSSVFEKLIGPSRGRPLFSMRPIDSPACRQGETQSLASSPLLSLERGRRRVAWEGCESLSASESEESSCEAWRASARRLMQPMVSSSLSALSEAMSLLLQLQTTRLYTDQWVLSGSTISSTLVALLLGTLSICCRPRFRSSPASRETQSSDSRITARLKALSDERGGLCGAVRQMESAMGQYWLARMCLKWAGAAAKGRASTPKPVLSRNCWLCSFSLTKIRQVLQCLDVSTQQLFPPAPSRMKIVQFSASSMAGPRCYRQLTAPACWHTCLLRSQKWRCPEKSRAMPACCSCEVQGRCFRRQFSQLSWWSSSLQKVGQCEYPITVRPRSRSFVLPDSCSANRVSQLPYSCLSSTSKRLEWLSRAREGKRDSVTQPMNTASPRATMSKQPQKCAQQGEQKECLTSWQMSLCLMLSWLPGVRRIGRRWLKGCRQVKKLTQLAPSKSQARSPSSSITPMSLSRSTSLSKHSVIGSEILLCPEQLLIKPQSPNTVSERRLPLQEGERRVAANKSIFEELSLALTEYSKLSVLGRKCSSAKRRGHLWMKKVELAPRGEANSLKLGWWLAVMLTSTCSTPHPQATPPTHTENCRLGQPEKELKKSIRCEAATSFPTMVTGSWNLNFSPRNQRTPKIELLLMGSCWARQARKGRRARRAMLQYKMIDQGWLRMTLKLAMALRQMGHLLVEACTEERQPLQRHRWLQGSMSVSEAALRQMMHSLLESPLQMLLSSVTTPPSSSFSSSTLQCSLGCRTFRSEYSVFSARSSDTTRRISGEPSAPPYPPSGSSFRKRCLLPAGSASPKKSLLSMRSVARLTGCCSTETTPTYTSRRLAELQSYSNSRRRASCCWRYDVEGGLVDGAAATHPLELSPLHPRVAARTARERHVEAGLHVVGPQLLHRLPVRPHVEVGLTAEVVVP